MKLHLPNITPRTRIKPNKRDDILNYDIDNSYPQRVLSHIVASGVAVRCADIYKKFIIGEGFETAVNKTIINHDGDTIAKLLSDTAKDFSRFNGFGIHVQYNLALEIASVSYVPFEELRLGIPDDNNRVSEIAHHVDWARLSGKRIQKKDITRLNVYNPKPEVVMQQIQNAGGIQNWKGQILYYSAEGKLKYPLAVCDSVIEDVETDAGIKTFKNKTVRTGFINNYLFLHKGKFEDEEERKSLEGTLADFQGTENSNSIMVVEVEEDDQKPELEKLESHEVDKVFEVTESSVQQNIRRCYGTPPVLLDSTPGKLGTDNEIEGAYAYMNSMTGEERELFTMIFSELFSHWKTPITEGFDITERVFGDKAEEETEIAVAS